MTTPAEAIEAQRQAYHDLSECYDLKLISGEELARLYAIKDAFEKVMAMLGDEGIDCDNCDGVGGWHHVDGGGSRYFLKCHICQGTGKRAPVVLDK